MPIKCYMDEFRIIYKICRVSNFWQSKSGGWGDETWVTVHFEHLKEGCVADIDNIFHVHSDVNGLEGEAVLIWDVYVVEQKSHHRLLLHRQLHGIYLEHVRQCAALFSSIPSDIGHQFDTGN